jgi:hypothetical protein
MVRSQQAGIMRFNRCSLQETLNSLIPSTLWHAQNERKQRITACPEFVDGIVQYCFNKENNLNHLGLIKLQKLKTVFN